MIYHYTSLAGLEGILKNKELWMTSHEFLNDSQEYIEGFHRIKETVEQYIEQNSSILNNEQKEAIKLTIDWLDNTILFVTSFSNAKDRKSQWEYGDYSIEFEESLLRTSNNDGVIKAIRPCLYNSYEKDRQAKVIGEGYIKGFAKNPQKMDLYYLFIGYMKYLTRAKNEYFFEEEEIRLSTYIHKKNIDIYTLLPGEIGSAYDAPVHSQGPVKLFSKVDLFKNPFNSKIHHSYPIKLESIKSITISSKIYFEENNTKIKKLLNELNLDVPIYKSQIPFRMI